MTEQDGAQSSTKQRRSRKTSTANQQNGKQARAAQRPANDDTEAWRVYWRKQGQPWRREPEIDTERQKYLAERRAIVPDIEKGIYPFKSIKLTRADVEWLLATHDDGQGHVGPVDWKDEAQIAIRKGLDLRGADLRNADLNNLPLARLRGGLSVPEGSGMSAEQRDLAGVHLEGAHLDYAHLEASDLNWGHFERAWLNRTHQRGVDLKGAHLEAALLHEAELKGVTLSEAHLEGASLYCTHLEQAELDSTHLEGAVLIETHLEGAKLINAHLEGAKLINAHLEGANLKEAHLEGANLKEAHLEGANLNKAYMGRKLLASTDLERIRKWYQRYLVPATIEDYPSILSPTDIRLAYFDAVTKLDDLDVNDEMHGGIRIADVHWNNVNITVVKWLQMTMLGDEYIAREKMQNGKVKDRATRLIEHQVAIRANRQLVVALRNQGLNEEADYFAYRAQLLQRVLWRRQRKFLKYALSWFLYLIAGYGYRPIRSVIWYLVIIVGFALAYHILGQLSLFPPDAFVYSLTSFHGRGFFPGLEHRTSLHDPLIMLAAIEAVVGLFIEISFIATFTQRFFGK